MPSREEIINSLNACMDVHQSGLWSSGCMLCAYEKQSNPKCFMDLTKDVIELLKEQPVKDTNVPSKWISVEDRLPDKQPCEYLVVNGNNVENWMFANGFNSGVWASTNWISVKDRMPEEHESIFYKFLGTRKWSNSMWKQESEKVLVYVSFPDGTGVVTTGCLHNSDWVTTVSKTLPQTVTHWMPLPEPPEVKQDD